MTPQRGVIIYQEQNEECFLKILQDSKKKLSTKEILDRTDKFPDLCSGCKGGIQVISAGLNLMRSGLIVRDIGKGGFLWSLNT